MTNTGVLFGRDGGLDFPAKAVTTVESAVPLDFGEGVAPTAAVASVGAVGEGRVASAAAVRSFAAIPGSTALGEAVVCPAGALLRGGVGREDPCTDDPALLSGVALPAPSGVVWVCLLGGVAAAGVVFALMFGVCEIAGVALTVAAGRSLSNAGCTA